ADEATSARRSAPIAARASIPRPQPAWRERSDALAARQDHALSAHDQRDLSGTWAVADDGDQLEPRRHGQTGREAAALDAAVGRVAPPDPEAVECQRAFAAIPKVSPPRPEPIPRGFTDLDSCDDERGVLDLDRDPGRAHLEVMRVAVHPEIRVEVLEDPGMSDLEPLVAPAPLPVDPEGPGGKARRRGLPP